MIIFDPEQPGSLGIDEESDLVTPVYILPTSPDRTPTIEDLKRGVPIGWGKPNDGPGERNA